MIKYESGKLMMDGKTIGEMVDEKTLLMKRNKERHHYRALDAWCLNIDVVNSGISRFVIDTVQRERFVIHLEKINQLRKHINMFVSFGSERQLAIPIQCWDRYVYENLSFPAYIGMEAADFADTCRGRWQSRLISHQQIEIRM